MALWPWTALMGFVFGVSVVLGRGALEVVPYVALPWSCFALLRLFQTQRALAAGYSLADLRLALRCAWRS